MTEEADKPTEIAVDTTADKSPTPAQAPETPPSEPEDAFAPKQGETLEVYAARMRGEVNWRDRELGSKHRQLKERLTKAQEIEAENARLRQLADRAPQPQAQTPPNQPIAQTPPQSQPQGFTPEVLNAAQLELTRRRVEGELTAHKDWITSSANYQRAGGIPQDMLNDLLVADNSAEVIIALGKDMAKFQQIRDLPVDQRRAAVLKMGWQLTAPAETKVTPEKPSGAPAPVRPLQSGGSAPAQGERFNDLYDKHVTDFNQRPGGDTSDNDDAWYALRSEQKRNSKGRPWSLGGKQG